MGSPSGGTGLEDFLRNAINGFSREKQAYSNAKAQTLANTQGRATNKDVMAEYLKSDAGKSDQMAKNYNNLDVTKQTGYDAYLDTFKQDIGFDQLLANQYINSVAGRKL